MKSDRGVDISTCQVHLFVHLWYMTVHLFVHSIFLYIRTFLHGIFTLCRAVGTGDGTWYASWYLAAIAAVSPAVGK